MRGKASITADLRRLGLKPGDLVMVHASLKALGPVEGGAAGVVQALLDALRPGGTVMGYASWDRSPYEETLNGARMDEALRRDWPAFDPRTAGTYRGFGLLNQFLADLPEARRSAHPDASMVAVGPLAGTLDEPHRLGQALREGSPLERFVRLGGKTLLLGAPLDAVTVLHYAEAVADIPGKRRVSYEMPMPGPDGRTIWEAATDFDSNGILDCFAVEGQPDAVETIARAYVATGRYREGMVGAARCHLFDAQDIVAFGVDWLERQFGSVPESGEDQT
ncbi:aminoglycoside 3-N-acetyltransferase [Paracoccus denitrificans]|jgi:aminoglycoside 3-N-acetyltransferase/aminoglycoside 3-N-acetyltransferase-2|uniref:Aminoglycoside N(3)-acetyltransferase n=1 Tax=Paracoccus denitrificans (strain Pd 1222) TaxID=318586 RepID=A1B6U1_PARDP|nr:aminoglycoside 3-N-acetyltransferase [Paracoccus denitrificans]ABL71235.1 Aminoglycoside N(3')-acetyltransferase [Paracoccus denitrificans PD1222]MBB4630213.1 aminoglycoside 3-N-acetyltransferase/aminoglycoside 3-N-acetyltransferase-2 [Paracoccus denitrificans]MCU7431654.1 aminoglycoside 3-N-acetyltransferase [Paracoccus denitrificans]QAR27873.1 aminoglycoside 3-N-acetyltransferase [Paracoccus denitrificans]UPV97586.1 aminoglycoside 3-N-acetyltransferase [Paracoccus denitrificans]